MVGRARHRAAERRGERKRTERDARERMAVAPDDLDFDELPYRGAGALRVL